MKEQWTNSGEGWRKTLGYVVVAYMVVSVFLAVGLMYWRRKYEPARTRGWFLFSISALGSLLMLQVPIREIIGNENFPCEARLITSFLFPPLWAGPLLLASAKLFCLMKIERLKNVIARQEPKRRENKSHVLTMQGPHGLFEIEDPNRTEAFVEVQEFGKEEHELRKFQWIISNKSMFLLILIISTPSIIAIMIFMLSQTEKYFSGKQGCVVSTQEQLTVLVVCLFPFSITLFIGRAVSRVREAFGIRKTLFRTLIVTFLFYFLFLGAKVAAYLHNRKLNKKPKYMWETQSYNIGYIIVLAVAIDLYNTAFYPVYLTFLSPKQAAHSTKDQSISKTSIQARKKREIRRKDSKRSIRQLSVAKGKKSKKSSPRLSLQNYSQDIDPDHVIADNPLFTRDRDSSSTRSNSQDNEDFDIEKARAQSENINLRQILSSRLGMAYFLAHCKTEFSTENVLFWKAVEDYKRLPTKTTRDFIFNTYIRADSPLEINLPYNTRKDIVGMMTNQKQQDEEDTSPTFFDKAQNQIFRLMESDSLPRFIESYEFQQYVSQKSRRLTNMRTHTESIALAQLDLVEGQVVRTDNENPHWEDAPADDEGDSLYTIVVHD